MKEGDIPNDEPKKHASIVKNVVATTFALILMAIFAFVAVLTKPLDPVKRAMDMRDKEDRKPEEKRLVVCTAHNGDTARCCHYGLLCPYNGAGKTSRSD